MYKAYKNGNLIFDTSIPELCFSTARLSLVAGTSGDFVFTVPPDHPSYNTFDKLVDYIEVFRDDDLIFSGRIYSIEKTFDTQQRITCEGMLAVFNDSIFRPTTYDGTLHNLVAAIVQSHNDQVESRKEILVGNLLVSNSQVYREYESYATSISRLQDLAASFGGFFAIRKYNGAFYLDWHASYDQGNSQSVDFGSNILDIKTEDNASRIITILIPLGYMDDDGNRLTIKSVNSGLDYIEASEAYIQQYGYVVGSKIWDDVTEASNLKTKGQAWLTSCLTPVMTIKVTAVDLADAGYDVGQFIVGQKLKVTSVPHEITGQWFDCTEQHLDLLHPENNQLVLGSEQVGYTRAQRSISSEIQYSIEKISHTYTPRSALQTAIDTATSMITGNSGGYVVLHDSNDDGEPDELLIMDTPDINTAVKVWRFNNSGLGFSSTGYDGTYGLAMTMNGAIVADYITTGTLNADVLRAGVIRGQTGNTYWDLVTGEFHMEGTGDIDKSKNFITEPTTPYYVGDLWVTEYSKNSGVAGYAIAGDAVVGDDDHADGTGSIMMCIYTRTSGAFRQEDWALVTDYIDATAMQTLQTRMSEAEINISAAEAAIQLKADTSTVSDLSSRVSQAEIDVAGYDGRINLLASNIETVSEEIAQKSKTFYQQPVSPYEVGDTWITSEHESYNAIAGSAVAGYALCNWGKEIYVCIHARTDQESFSMNDWILATQYVGQSELVGVYQRISNAEVNIDAANARIDLKADQTVVTALSKRVSTAEVDINAANARINLKANQSDLTALTNRVSTAEVDINAAEAQIALKANITTVNALTGRVSDAEAAIQVNATNIASKVSQTDYNGATIASLINQSASTVTIAASHINLTGQNIADRINNADSSVAINASHIDLAGETVNMSAGALTMTTSGSEMSAIELVYGTAKIKLSPGTIQLHANNTKRIQLHAGTLMMYDSSGNFTFGISSQTGSITFKNSLFKIVTKDFWARLAGTAQQQYWEEGSISVTADAGYEIVGLGGFSAIAYVADGQYQTLGNSSMINVYRACVTQSGNNHTLYYGFSNGGVTTWDVHFYYFLLEAYTKGTIS